MRKFLDTKAGATFFEELPNLTINPRNGEAPIFALLDNHVLDLVNMLVNKNVEIYNELNTNPPFPAWKDGLSDLWN